MNSFIAVSVSLLAVILIFSLASGNFTKLLETISGLLDNSELVYDSTKEEATDRGPATERQNVEELPIKILISEVSPSGFVELYNAGNGSVDLSGFIIKKTANSGTESTLVTSKRFSGKNIKPHHYFLITRDGSGMAADVYWPKSYSLPDGKGTLSLYKGENEIDEVSWDNLQRNSSLTRISWNENDFMETAIPTPQSETY